MPTTKWTTPIDWLSKEKVTAEDMNAQIANNMQWLFEKNITVVQRAGITDPTTAITTTPTTATTGLYSMQLEKASDDTAIQININASVYNNGAGNYTYFDVLMDDAIFLSSGTDVPLSQGLAYVCTQVLNRPIPLQVIRTITNISKGGHNFELIWWVSAGTSGINYTNTLGQFLIEEYGVPNFQ